MPKGNIIFLTNVCLMMTPDGKKKKKKKANEIVKKKARDKYCK